MSDATFRPTTARELEGVLALQSDGHAAVERGKPGALALYRERGFLDHDRTLMTKRVSARAVAVKEVE
jgi:hypothetical protein